jgi:hypothetical protein
VLKAAVGCAALSRVLLGACDAAPAAKICGAVTSSAGWKAELQQRDGFGGATVGHVYKVAICAPNGGACQAALTFYHTLGPRLVWTSPNTLLASAYGGDASLDRPRLSFGFGKSPVLVTLEHKPLPRDSGASEALKEEMPKDPGFYNACDFHVFGSNGQTDGQ